MTKVNFSLRFMIRVLEEDKRLLEEIGGEISNEEMLQNWKQLMAFTPCPSGSVQEEEAIQFIASKLREYGLEPEILRYDAYISEPKWARLEILSPSRFEVQCTPYRQVGSTGSGGIEGEVVYIEPDKLGEVECRDKIVLAEQETPGEWMGLMGPRLLKLQEMGVKGLIVIEQDSYMPTVVHQRADFSVSGNPTPENIHLIPTIPAIVHVTNRDGQRLKAIAKEGGMRARVTSVVETGWRTLPLVVAEIKGFEEPEKFLLVNGHVDTPPFSPGSVDNVSGVVALLELARILSRHRNGLRRSVRFAFWTGHEIGRYAGSTWYNDAYWHELRYNCIGFLNIDSPGVAGATQYRAVSIGEMQELCRESIAEVTGIKVEGTRWPSRAGDHSFWGTGLPHASVISARPKELYDPFVNYSGGGWWWHTPYETFDKGDVAVLAKDVKVNLNVIFKMTNCPILPLNFVPYAEAMLRILEELQGKSEKIASHFNIYPVIERCKEFRELSERLEEVAKRAVESGAREAYRELNRCLMKISRYINPIAHSNAEATEQMSMETFGAAPFPRLQGIVKLAEMPLPHGHEFKLLRTKLQRDRNYVEDGFYLANETIKETLAKIKDLIH